ncbi:MAG TPA: radical SAM protein, partial [Bacteroidota bacterium]|nr:radical SAM protein [Bacteroidota bacterium]
MSANSYRWLYGPVPSRRLGRSLGIDLVPFKTCSFDCIYCQLGRTTDKTLERKEYVPIGEVLAELERKLGEEDRPDYISLAGSGEPTLNSGIGSLISGIKNMTDIPVAVLTNGSLLWMSEVQDALMHADLVIPSLDAGDKYLFQYVNRPHEDLSFDQIVDGLVAFTGRFTGEVWLEVLLLAGVTGIRSEAEKIAALAKRVGAARVQLNTASRPPAEDYAFALPAEEMLALKSVFPGRVDIISERECDDVNASPAARATDDDILALLSRRPCTPMGVAMGLGIHVTEAVKHLDGLLKAAKVTTVLAEGRVFYS